MYFLLKMGIFQCHVSFREGNPRTIHKSPPAPRQRPMQHTRGRKTQRNCGDELSFICDTPHVNAFFLAIFCMCFFFRMFCFFFVWRGGGQGGAIIHALQNLLPHCEGISFFVGGLRKSGVSSQGGNPQLSKVAPTTLERMHRDCCK